MSVNHDEFSFSDKKMNLILPKQEIVTCIATQLFMQQAGFSSNDVAKYLLKKYIFKFK